MALPEDWEKLSKEKQKAYKYMLERGNKNKMLRALPDLNEEAFAQIDCLSCANCCKNHSPRFKQPDIRRIAKSLGMKEGQLVDTYLKLDSEGDYVTKRSPCPFLAEDNTCNIYDDRPSDCARYPYTNEDVLLKRVPLTLQNSLICPIVYTVLERLGEMEK
ncbi:MAG: YkgJ family cysteine cluster protein [Bacteroidota bacterium]